ncbi:MAG: cell division protein FtsZ [Ancalomicrobiaceae bacterium]|nr:cell division protein FtsZ [Ancalomicrobiaceae bacterium]
MTLNLKMPDIRELRPRITVFGVGGAGGNAVNNMIQAGLKGVDFVVANTDAQALTLSKAERIVQMGVAVTEGLGAGSMPEVGAAAAEEVIDEISDHLSGAHMVFITAGMGGGTGTGAAPVVARVAREHGILTVGVVTKPFQFEGARRMRIADNGIIELQKSVDTLIVIPNQNLFRIANERTTFADAFAMADQVLYSGVACITDLMVKEGLINLDFADVRSIMRGMGKAMMGTGESSGEKRALQAAEAAIANPLLDETSMKGARGVLISISGGKDLTLFEVDEAATRIREEVDPDANIILGATFDDSLEGVVRVSVVATGIDQLLGEGEEPVELPVRSRVAPRSAEPTQASRTSAQAFVRTDEATVAQRRAEALAVATARAEAEARLEREMALPEPQAQPAYTHVTQPAYTTVAQQDPAVTIERFEPKPTDYAHVADPIHEIETPQPPRQEAVLEQRPYIPPQAERPTEQRMATRMPRIEEFPPIAQRQITQPQAADPAHGDDERRPMSLLKRLASGFRREDHEGDGPLTQGMSQPMALPREPTFREEPKRPLVQGPQRSSTDQMHRPAPGQLDPHGRQPTGMPQQRLSDDDQLEIPAFLRRQVK